MSAPDEKPTFGKLTDRSFELSRLRLGIPQPQYLLPHNYEVTWDGSRQFAYGYGDDNPLYCDPNYAEGTVWGGLVAPPTFLYTMGEDSAPTPTAEQKQVLKGDPFAGLGSYQAVMEFEWWNPLRRGDRCHMVQAQVGVEPHTSKFGGRSAHVTHAFVYANDEGPVALRRGVWINVEREASRSRGGDRRGPDRYTDSQLAEIDAAYLAETRRGNEPRFFEDVKIGDELQPRVKGPLTTTHVVVWHMGWGMQLSPPGAFRLEAAVRRKVPGMYPANVLGIPDTVQRLHWDPDRARELGLPTSYDYGGMRETWLCHIVTDWMGDNAWLWKLRCEHRGFNYTGDTTWIRGRVVDKRVTERGNEVDVQLEGVNQRDEVTTRGSATILLPSAANPTEPATPPSPPGDTLHAIIQHEMEASRGV